MNRANEHKCILCLHLIIFCLFVFDFITYRRTLVPLFMCSWVNNVISQFIESFSHFFTLFLLRCVTFTDYKSTETFKGNLQQDWQTYGTHDNLSGTRKIQIIIQINLIILFDILNKVLLYTYKLSQIIQLILHKLTQQKIFFSCDDVERFLHVTNLLFYMNLKALYLK